MSVKIRLQRRGRKKRPFYHIIIADSRSPRDGRFIEKIGTYNPMTVPATINLDAEKAYDWLMKGAQPTETARAILRFKGVLYKKHLMQGVQKGALTEEEAMVKHSEWLEAKEAKIKARREKAAQEKADFLEKVAGTPPPPPKEDVPEPEKETEAPAAEEAETPTAKEVTEAAAEETPEAETETVVEPAEEKKKEATAEAEEETKG